MNFQDFLVETANPKLDALAKEVKGKPESEKKGEAVKKYVKKAIVAAENAKFEGFNPLMEKRDNSRPILPASRILYNKNKMTPHELVKHPDHGQHSNGSGQIETWEHYHYDNKTGNETKKHFHIDGGGGSGIGTQSNFHHDQTFAHHSNAKLVGITHYSGGQVTHHEGEDHTKTAAPVHVYK
jgi:hypothetical protein